MLYARCAAGGMLWSCFRHALGMLWACFRYADDVGSLHVLDYARLVESRPVEAYMQSFSAMQRVHLHQITHRVAHGILFGLQAM